MGYRIGLLALGLSVGCAGSAFAQATPTADQIDMLHRAAANQLGVLEYCQAQGNTDGAAVAAQKALMTKLPGSSSNTDDAEALGKQGTVSVNGNTLTLASAAETQKTTVAALCKQMADTVVQTAKMSGVTQ